jgi:hypothetical protein
MKLRMAQRGMDNNLVALIEKFGEFNARGDRIVLSRTKIRNILNVRARGTCS